MATFYLDLESGNDANDGTTFANRWLTFNSGATAARIAPGDTIRVMASPDPTLVDSNASWTQNSKTITLSSAVTANISTCETAWTASANITATTSGTRKEGSLASSIAFASAFTTGLAAYFATGTLDLSGYQQVSFWFRTSVTIAANTLSLRLCTDTAGATSVHTIAIPAVNVTGGFIPFTVNLGTNLNSAIKSVALYADLDPGTPTVIIDNIIAVKAASSADSLSLTSLIGKVHNLSWVASTTYASNDKRRPTQTNRNGYQYRVSAGGGGSSGSSEPTWPIGIGNTVTDGALTWTCEELEDSWYPIQSINGTTVLIDNTNGTLANAGRGYSRATESVATYKRETINLAMPSSFGATMQVVQDSGSFAGGNIIFDGGWDRTNMSTKSGETWASAQNGNGIIFSAASKNYVTLSNLNPVRGQAGIQFTNGVPVVVTNCHGCGHANYGLDFNNGNTMAVLQNVNMNNQGATGIISRGSVKITGRAISGNGNLTSGSQADDNGSATPLNTIVDYYGFNNGVHGLNNLGATPYNIAGAKTGNNGTSGIRATFGSMNLINASIADATEFTLTTTLGGYTIKSTRHDQTDDNHLITTDGGTIISATDQRHTASGISWKFRPTSTTRDSYYPLSLSVGRFKCDANVAKSFTIWTRRDNTNIMGRLIVEGGQLPGIGETYVDCSPTINTWVQSSTLTVTPTSAGVIEVKFLVWDGVGTSNNFWIDDIGVS